MAEVIGVRFKDVGKVLLSFRQSTGRGDMVMVESHRGIECGEVAMENRQIQDEGVVQPLKPVIRVATPEDLKKVEENRRKEKSAFGICEKKIADHKLEMKLVERRIYLLTTARFCFILQRMAGWIFGNWSRIWPPYSELE